MSFAPYLIESSVPCDPGKVEIRGFGRFHTRQSRARVGQNPKTGASVDPDRSDLAEYFFGAFPFALTHLVAFVPRGASIEITVSTGNEFPKVWGLQCATRQISCTGPPLTSDHQARPGLVFGLVDDPTGRGPSADLVSSKD